MWKMETPLELHECPQETLGLSHSVFTANSWQREENLSREKMCT